MTINLFFLSKSTGGRVGARGSGVKGRGGPPSAATVAHRFPSPPHRGCTAPLLLPSRACHHARAHTPPLGLGGYSLPCPRVARGPVHPLPLPLGSRAASLTLPRPTRLRRLAPSSLMEGLGTAHFPAPRLRANPAPSPSATGVAHCFSHPSWDCATSPSHPPLAGREVGTRPRAGARGCTRDAPAPSVRTPRWGWYSPRKRRMCGGTHPLGCAKGRGVRGGVCGHPFPSHCKGMGPNGARSLCMASRSHIALAGKGV